MEEYSTSVCFNTETKESIAVQCSGMRSPSWKLLENCRKKLSDKDDFLLSFISIETFDIIYSFLTLIVIYICIINILILQQEKKKGYSTARAFFTCLFAIFYMAATALTPFYLGISYSILFYKSVLTLTIFIGCSQILGVLVICRVIKNKRQKEGRLNLRFR